MFAYVIVSFADKETEKIWNRQISRYHWYPMKKIRLAPPGELLLKEFICPNGMTVYRVASVKLRSLEQLVKGESKTGQQRRSV